MSKSTAALARQVTDTHDGVFPQLRYVFVLADLRRWKSFRHLGCFFNSASSPALPTVSAIEISTPILGFATRKPIGKKTPKHTHRPNYSRSLRKAKSLKKPSILPSFGILLITLTAIALDFSAGRKVDVKSIFQVKKLLSIFTNGRRYLA